MFFLFVLSFCFGLRVFRADGRFLKVRRSPRWGIAGKVALSHGFW